MFKSPSCLFEYSILVNITAEELQAKGNTLIPRFRNDTDKPGNDWRVEKVLHMPFDITISFKNLKAKDEKILNGSIMSIRILQLILKLFLFKPKASKNSDNINREMTLSETPLQTGLVRKSAPQGSELTQGKRKPLMGVWGSYKPSSALRPFAAE